LKAEWEKKTGQKISAEMENEWRSAEFDYLLDEQKKQAARVRRLEKIQSKYAQRLRPVGRAGLEEYLI
jgi:hypothetical protein